MAGELTPQQIDFLANYLDPKSETYSNATQSAIKAGYSQDYADNLTSLMPDWLSESIGRQRRIVEKAEKNLETFMDTEDEKVKADMTKFALSRLKKEKYSDRIEHTGKDGGEILIKQVSYGDRDNNTSSLRTEILPTEPIESTTESAV